ncbi:MAG: 50S ribosomal protein L25 [Verrucomicrobiota bacterium]
MKAVKLAAQKRDIQGTEAVRRLRGQGLVPAIVYGSGKEGQMIQLNAHDLEQTLRGHRGEHMVMELEVDGGKALKVLLKEIQHHPVSGKIIHADFNEISMTRKLRVEIPIRLVGEAAGVSQQGGVLEHIMRVVEVECLPADIIEHVDLDVAGLHIGESLTMANVKLDPAKYTVLSAPSQAVAAVAAPRAEEEVVAPEAAAVEGAVGEPEVITAKKVEGEEGEEGVEEGKGEGKKEGKKEGKAEGKKEGKAEAKPESKGKPEAKGAAPAKGAPAKEEGKKK